MSYELSDNPHPVGTPEHHRWVVDVYIPALSDDQREQHRKRAGAEAIGKQLIRDTRRFNFTIGDVDYSDLVKSVNFSLQRRTDDILTASGWANGGVVPMTGQHYTIDEDGAFIYGPGERRA